MACTTALPALTVSYCTPTVNYGQIRRIFFTRLGDDMTDWTDDEEWGTRLDNSTALPSPPTLAGIRYLNVIGSLPEPEIPELEISLGRKVYNIPRWTLSARVDETSTNNIAFARTVQAAGAAIYAVWYETADKMYGGNSGLTASLKIAKVIPESKDELEYLQVTITFEGAEPTDAATIIPSPEDY